MAPRAPRARGPEEFKVRLYAPSTALEDTEFNFIIIG